MADQTVAGAVEQVAAPKMISPERFADVLPKHLGPEKFTRWALTLLQRPDIAAVARTPEGQLSVVTALLDCATLGLEPGRTYHLVPYGGKVTGMTDYKGEIQLITNASRCVVVARLVHERDSFVMLGANVPPRHSAPDEKWFADRGGVIGGYAFTDFGGGLYSLVVTMTEDEFLTHRKAAKTKNVWDEWPEAMRLKTLVHQLRKWVPWSAEVRDTR